MSDSAGWDASTSASVGAVVLAAAAMMIAAAQVAQQYISSGPLIRLCDSYVYGPMPGAGHRVWSMRQFRFRVLYSIPQVRLPARYWAPTETLDERTVNEELKLRLLPDLVSDDTNVGGVQAWESDEQRAGLGTRTRWRWLSYPFRTALAMAAFGKRRKGLLSEKPGSESSDLESRPQGSGSLLREATGPLAFDRNSGEACWVSFCRMAQMRLSLRLCYQLYDGDADRCPGDLQVVPMMVSLRDIVAICFMFGMRLVWADVSRRLVQMEGEVGTMISTPHPQLSVLTRFVPRNLHASIEHAYPPHETTVHLWIKRLNGEWAVGGRCMNSMAMRRILRGDDWSTRADVINIKAPATGYSDLDIRKFERAWERSARTRSYHQDARTEEVLGGAIRKENLQSSAYQTSEFRQVTEARKRFREATRELEDVQSRIRKTEAEIAKLRIAVPMSSDALDLSADPSAQPDTQDRTVPPASVLSDITAQQAQMAAAEAVLPSDKDVRPAGSPRTHSPVHLELRGGGADESDMEVSGDDTSVVSVRITPGLGQPDATESLVGSYWEYFSDSDTTPPRSRQSSRQGRPAFNNWDTDGGSKSPYWLCQLDIIPGFWVSNLKNRKTLPGFLWTAVLSTCLKQLLPNPALQFFAWESSAFRSLCRSLADGQSTYPVYAYSGGGQSASGGNYADPVIFPGFESKKLLPVAILAQDLVQPQAPGGTNKEGNDQDLASLMALDTWLNDAGSSREITAGGLALITDTPIYVSTLFNVFQTKVDELKEDQDESGAGSDVPDGVDAQLLEALASNVLKGLKDWGLSPAEEVFVLIASLRAAKVGWCLAKGLDASVVEDVFRHESSVYLA